MSDPVPRHRDDSPVKRTWWVPMLRMSVAADVMAAIPHTPIQLPFADGTWTLHTAADLIFMMGVIDSLFPSTMRHKP